MTPSPLISELERIAARHELAEAKFLGLGQKRLAELAKARAEGLREAIEIAQEQSPQVKEVAGA
jgi:hypothetical protein